MSTTGINTNLAALNAQRNLQGSATQMTTALQRLSSGLRVNSSKDDAAGVAIADRMTTQVRGLDRGVRNLGDGISLAQTAEGGLDSIASNLQRIRELAVQAANFTPSPADRASLQLEVAELKEEITRISNQTSFNGVKLLNGGFGSAIFQGGANVGESIVVDGLVDSRAAAIGVGGRGTLSFTQNVTAGPSAIQTVKLGASSNYALGVMAQDAKLLAAAINAIGNSSIPGLSATAAANVRDGSSATASPTTTTYSFMVNGYALSISGGSDANANRVTAVAALNAMSGLTGVTAADLGSGIRLTEPGGGNIRINELTAGASSYFGLGGLTSVDGLGSSVTVNYAAPVGSVPSTLTFTNTGMATETFATPGYRPVDSVDLSTVAGANDALTIVDAALEMISRSRASLGAAMNRFESAIGAQRIGIESQTASRSRIRDADFAAETAAMTRAKILQSSGLAVLAQANAAPTRVLSLLR